MEDEQTHSLRVDIVTIFPEMLDGVLNTGMLKIGREKGLLDLRAVNLRDYTTDRHHQTDDTPAGGGAGMVMIPGPLFACVEALTAGETEVRAWTFHNGDRAPQAAGVIHSDFEKGFIKAEVYHFDDLMVHHSEAELRNKGKLRIEGKEYLVQDGDIMHFRFNV